VPLIVVTSAEEKSREADRDQQAVQSLALADKVYEALSKHFSVDSWEIWDTYPRSWLGGRRVGGPVAGRMRPSGFHVPELGEYGQLDSAPVSTKPAIHGNHCIVLRGELTPVEGVTVPATLEVNLARRYARGTKGKGGAGDIVFDTQKTVDYPFDGLYELLVAMKQESASFRKGLEDRMFRINDSIERGPRVTWFSLKAVEGASPPSSDMFFFYGRDTFRLSSFLRTRLLELATERAAPVYEEMDLRSKPVFEQILDGMVGRLTLSNVFDRASANLGREFGIRLRTGGSAMISSSDPQAITRVAREILDAVEQEFLDELRREIGASVNFDRPLAKLAERHSDNT
jgi:hypothetical protein